MNLTPTNAILERLRARFGAFPLVERWGVELLALEPGEARMRLCANVHTCNPEGDRVNGGVLATLMDMACAVALSTMFDGSMPFYTSDLHLRYLEPATGDVEAEARILRRSPRSAVLEGRLRVGSTLVALGTCHFTIKVGRSNETSKGPQRGPLQD